MTKIQSIFKNLKRPKLLIRAARLGMADYRRDRDLKRLTRFNRLPTPVRAMETLLALETHMDQSRRTGEGGYNISRHVEILSALMAEARLIPRNNPKAGVV